MVFITSLIQVFKIVLPVFLIVFLGIGLKLRTYVTESFVSSASRLVFEIALPALVFLTLATVSVRHIFDPILILFCITVIVGYTGLLWVFSYFFVSHSSDRAAFLQGCIRTNYAIIGLSLAWLIWGEMGLSLGAVILAFVVPVYNVLSIIILEYHRTHQVRGRQIVMTIAKTPLFWSAILGFLWSYMGWHLGSVMTTTLGYLAAMALPIALISIGATIQPAYLHKVSMYNWIACLIKLIIAPMIGTLLAIWFGFSGIKLGMIYLLFATPTAVASFVMAEAMGANAKLAGNIVVFTTLGSTITLPFGLFLLNQLNYIQL